MNSMTLFNPALATDFFDAMNAFDKNFDLGLPVFASSKNTAMPKVDVLEKKDLYLLQMDLPGFSEKDVEISLKENILTISSLAKGEKVEKIEGEYILKERNSKQFLRRFTLPNDIDSEKVNANFKNGVLSINIPRKEAMQKRTIAISSENA